LLVRICVFGAGSVGGYLAGHLSRGGANVSVVARGAHLAAIRANGLTVEAPDDSITVRIPASDNPADLGPQDIVLVTVKAPALPEVAASIEPLLHADTAVAFIMNGIPWWYFQKHGGPYEGKPIPAADPDGSIGRQVDPARIVGSVVYPAANLIEPGVVQVVEGKRFSLGELDGATTPRVQAIAAALAKAGFKAPITDDIRGEIWLKVWGNLSFNPISALTQATLVDLCQFPLTRQLSVDLMREAETIANQLGVTFKVGIERRIAGAERVGAHKTSMLQDVEQGKPLEIEALIGAVVDLGRLTQTPTPHIDAVYALVSLLAKTLATQGGKLRLA
jgi:2-dehydropantoate 2-reductase